MSYRSILVNLDIDGPVAPIVELATELAARSSAKLIGFCAADVPLPMVGPEGGDLSAQVWQQLKADVERRFKDLEFDFKGLVPTSLEVEWRSSLSYPTQALARITRLADLVVTGAKRGAATGDSYRAVDPGNVVLQAGRPLLVVATDAEHVLARTIVIAWKDTREARRAVSDAVPLLQSASDVIVVTVDPEPDDWIRDSVADVVAFLARHQIKARSEIISAADERRALTDFAVSCHADLVVSGAYGHSRLREWVFGGVTRSLLDAANLHRFMSS
ncbi:MULTISPECIES: universal stress protein [Ensifer]|uniref:universal stress protein n=1 Tax=Ensifer TaxID=106591 RepID=UPI00070DB7AA|nr:MULTISPECIES: universal stress protein [Ensifer]KQW51063.1 universal stress protein [Ensifer sp. Root1252]KRC54313.1 universal stress protein [Ensifer sp. Root231]KRD01647.1 universal stress protein [Ensifer sp. Root258]NOV17003.1 universal stress protein [Ensifer canadensis]